MSNNIEWPSYAQVNKVEELLADVPELSGKYNKADKVEVKKRGGDSPAKVLRFAAMITMAVKNKYAPTKEEVLQCGLKILESGVLNKTEPAVDTTDTETPDESKEAEEAEADTAPEAPTVTAKSVEHSDAVAKISEDLGIDSDIVEKVTEAFMARLSSSYVVGLIALANSLEFIAKDKDKLPGAAARLKAISDIRQQYVEAGMLTTKKPRS